MGIIKRQMIYTPEGNINKRISARFGKDAFNDIEVSNQYHIPPNRFLHRKSVLSKIIWRRMCDRRYLPKRLVKLNLTVSLFKASWRERVHI